MSGLLSGAFTDHRLLPPAHLLDLIPDRLQVRIHQRHFADFSRVADFFRCLKPVQRQHQVAELAGVTGQVVGDGLILGEPRADPSTWCPGIRLSQACKTFKDSEYNISS